MKTTKDLTDNEPEHKSDRLLFWIGVIGLVILAFWTFWMSERAERRVQQAADAVLTDGGFSWAEAEAHGQRVDISGAAPSDDSRDAAKQAVLSALGSGGVFSGGVTKARVRDVEVSPFVSPFSFGAIKENGKVALEGVVSSRAEMEGVLSEAQRLFGEENVSNRLQVAGGVPEGVAWGASVIAGLSALDKLDRGSVEMVGSDMLVTGYTTNANTADTVSRNLNAVDTGARVSVDLSGPAEWQAVFDGDALRFQGRVASQGVKADLERIGQTFGVPFSDDTVVGEAGDWGQRVGVALSHLSKFREGQVSVRGDTVDVRGAATGSVLAYLREDMAGISDEYGMMFGVTEVAPEVSEIAGVDLSGTGAEKTASCQQAFIEIMAVNDILFESSLANISRESGQTLDKLVEVARQCAELRIEVEGHTDATGQRATNRALSVARADAVRAYLEARGIPADQLSAVGYGEDRPVATNRTADGRAQNRRIEFKVSSVEGR